MAFDLIPITAPLLADQSAVLDISLRPVGNPDLERALKDYAYRVGPQDILSITVFEHPELTIPAGSFRTAAESGFVVHHDGAIFFPYAGKMNVAGRTTEEIRVLLTERLGEYIMDPKVQVRVAAFRSQRVTVTGQVMATNTVPITDIPLTALDAVNRARVPLEDTGAGGSEQRAEAADLSNVILYRGGRVERLDLRALLDYGDLSQNRLLQDGDILYVPDNSRNRYFMVGEFTEPRAYPMTRRDITLAEAIGSAKGFNFDTADPSRVYIVRGTPENLEVYWLDASAPHALVMADYFYVQPRDVIFASTADVVRLGRILRQILPLLQVGSSIGIIVTND